MRSSRLVVLRALVVFVDELHIINQIINLLDLAPIDFRGLELPLEFGRLDVLVVAPVAISQGLTRRQLWLVEATHDSVPVLELVRARLAIELAPQDGLEVASSLLFDTSDERLGSTGSGSQETLS